jgi:hypothetical protein
MALQAKYQTGEKRILGEIIKWLKQITTFFTFPDRDDFILTSQITHQFNLMHSDPGKTRWPVALLPIRIDKDPP